MKFIVTGSTGYLGRVFIEELFKQNIRPIKILVRSEEAFKTFQDYKMEIAVGSLLDRDFLEKEINEGDIVFHLAAMIDIVGDNTDLIYKTNVDATKLLADVCLEKNVEKFIYTSSSSAIDVSKIKKGFISEPESYSPNNVIGDYAKTKAIATDYVLKLANETELNAVVVMPSLIIGPKDYRVSEIGDLMIKYYKKRYSAFVRGSYNFVDVRDVAKGLINAYKLGKKGQAYLLTGETLTIREMFNILRTLTTKTKRHIYIPLPIIILIMPFINLYYKVKKTNPLFTKTSLKIINQNSNFSNAKAKRDLKFESRSVNFSFIDMLNWYIDNKVNIR